jgi:hypothetical protein
MSGDLGQFLAIVILLVGIPAILMILANVFLRRPFQRLVNRVFGSTGSSWSISKTIHLSTGSKETLRWRSTVGGTDPADLQVEGSGTAGLRPESVRRYCEAWRLIQERFPSDAAQSVRDAHSLVLELVRECGRPAQLTTEARIVEDNPSAALKMMGAVYEQIRDERGAAHATEKALAYENVSTAALAKAMQQYERVIEHLLTTSSAL